MNTVKQTTTPRATVWEGTQPQLMARVVGYDGANVVQADLSALTWKAWDSADTTTVVDSGTLTISAVIFDTLQTDARWTEDTTGYNFRHQLPATAIPDGGVEYVVQYKFVDTSSAAFYVDFELPTKQQYFD